MDPDFESWKKGGPWVFQDADLNREWLFTEPARYYIYQRREGEWLIIDRWHDVAHGAVQRTRAKAIREFYKTAGRRINTGTKLLITRGANFKG